MACTPISAAANTKDFHVVILMPIPQSCGIGFFLCPIIARRLNGLHNFARIYLPSGHAMPKFSLLPIGDTFEYQGEHYTKSGPLTASRLDNGSSRMIPRSAIVVPLSSAPMPSAEVPGQGKLLPAEQVLEAFAYYHKGCREWLAMTEKVDAELAATLREAMEKARQGFLSELNRL